MLKIVLGAVLLAMLLFSVNIHELVTILAKTQFEWVLTTIGAVCLIFYFQAFLLGVVSSPFATIPQRRLFAFTLIGRFFSLFLPSSVGGDFVKVVYLFPYFRKTSEAYAAIIMHRMLGGISTLAISFIACALYLPADLTLQTNTVATVLIVVILLSGFVYYKFKVSIWRIAREHRLKKEPENRFYRVGCSLLSALLAYRHSKLTVAVTFILSNIGTILNALLYMLIAQALQIHLSFEQALVSASATLLSVLLPLTPGGIGVSEGTFVVVSGIMGVPAEHALAITVLGRMIGYVTTAPGGILYIFMPARNASTSLTRNQPGK